MSFMLHCRNRFAPVLAQASSRFKVERVHKPGDIARPFLTAFEISPRRTTLSKRNHAAKGDSL